MDRVPSGGRKDIPPNCRMLMNCEGAELLQEIHEHMAIFSEDPEIKIPESFDKAFQYAKDGKHFTTANSSKQALEYPNILNTLELASILSSNKHGISDSICMIANIGPETIEEIYALVPSLKTIRSLTEGPITEVFAGLANIKTAN
ncbi:hypothetical protein BDA96_02G351900 [Sorghum bicolor]|uniref:RNA polymerase Rpb4/RPC9 core domain-containing protein n=1 Tax=Sorghum bicolor TaxID=4558 RepID=A0A921RTR3_SORBI|nr:hypothetical protein BDA96_02G351900 [Sorghum bicolor]